MDLLFQILASWVWCCHTGSEGKIELFIEIESENFLVDNFFSGRCFCVFF